MLQYELDDELPETIPFVKIGDENRETIYVSAAFMRRCGTAGDFEEPTAVANVLLAAEDHRRRQSRLDKAG